MKSLPTGTSLLLKSLKFALFGFVGVYALCFISYISWWFIRGAKDGAVEPVPIFLWSITPGIVGAIIAFVLTLFHAGRKLEQPLSLMKGRNGSGHAD
jgi:hypothetical protein